MVENTVAKGSNNGRKPVFWLLLSLFMAFILLLPASIFSNVIMNYYNQFSENVLPWSSSAEVEVDDLTSNCSSALKVYMYDLPRKYNIGMLQKGDENLDEIPWTSHVAPPWAPKFQVNNQHSVEYWMMVYLLDCADETKSAVRVKHPEDADVFFVPFFSALSFNSHGGMVGAQAAQDKQLQAGVVDILFKSKWWQASQGRDHVIVVHHPNAFRHYRDMLNQSVFIVADFGRCNKSVASLEKDVVAPYVHVLPFYHQDNAIDPFSLRKTLLFFQGRIRRKGDGVIRAKLKELLANNADVHFADSVASSKAIVTATEGMRSSRFCLHPAGDTPSSCRLFDAIVNHCVPVIVSDKIELPFEIDLDYSEFAVFFSAEEALKPDHLLGSLRSIERERWLQMWQTLKAISHHFEYQNPSKQDDASNMIFKQVQRKLPAINLAVHRSQRLKVEDREDGNVEQN